MIRFDRLLHLTVGFIIMVVGSLVFNTAVAMASVILAAWGKEVLWDKLYQEERADHMDFLATVIGGLIGGLFYLIIR